MTYKANIWQYGRDKTLAHYASPYYDPVKAHEYYMRHRKLKGRRKGSGEQSPPERLSAEERNDRETLRRSAVQDAAEAQTVTFDKIADMRSEFKKMSKEERARKRQGLKAEVAAMRRSISQEIADIYAQLGDDIGGR